MVLTEPSMVMTVPDSEPLVSAPAAGIGISMVTGELPPMSMVVHSKVTVLPPSVSVTSCTVPEAVVVSLILAALASTPSSMVAVALAGAGAPPPPPCRRLYSLQRLLPAEMADTKSFALHEASRQDRAALATAMVLEHAQPSSVSAHPAAGIAARRHGVWSCQGKRCQTGLCLLGSWKQEVDHHVRGRTERQRTAQGGSPLRFWARAAPAAARTRRMADLIILGKRRCDAG